MIIRALLFIATLSGPYLCHGMLQVHHGECTYTFTGDTLEVIKEGSKYPTNLPYKGIPGSFTVHRGFGYAINVSQRTLTVIDTIHQCIVSTLRTMDQPKDTLIINNNFGYIPSAEGSRIYTLYFQDNHWCTVGVINGDFGYVSDEPGNWTVLDLKTNTVSKSLGIPYSSNGAIFYKTIGYFCVDNSMSTYNVVDLETHVCLGIVNKGKIQSIKDDFIQGSDSVIPVYPTLSTFNKMKKKGILDLFIHLNPLPFSRVTYEERKEPENPSLFEHLPEKILVDILTALAPVEAMVLLTTFKYPKAVLKKPLAKTFYEEKIHLTLFQKAWLKENREVQRLIHYCLQLDDPLITLLTRSVPHAPKHIQAGQLGSFIRTLQLSSDLVWSSCPNAKAVLEDTLWDEHGSIYKFVNYLQLNAPKLAEQELIHALQGNNPYARALMYFGHFYGVFGLTKSPLLALFYFQSADQRTIQKLTQEHAIVPFW